jgi:hypothetical protein
MPGWAWRGRLGGRIDPGHALEGGYFHQSRLFITAPPPPAMLSEASDADGVSEFLHD